MASESIHFVTGKLAAPAVREIVAKLSAEVGFRYTIDVLPITVAALMTAKWVKRHLVIPEGTSRVVLPGYLESHLGELQSEFNIPIQCGPRDIRDLPVLFGKKRQRPDDYGNFDIELIAEINHAPRYQQSQIVSLAQELIAQGADTIDVGCDPNARCDSIDEIVKAIVDLGVRVSIDTFDSWEAEKACRAGASLVLSVNSSNRTAACDWGAEVVVVPDVIGTLDGMQETASFLAEKGVCLRLDPILEPIGCGFARSLVRYAQTRELFPDAEIMMGIGNITELTDADSAGINVVLLGYCQELGIRSILTTQVINWARTAVRECDLARRLVYHSIQHRIPPKHLEPNLVILRDPKVSEFSAEYIKELAISIRDSNYRVLVQGGQLHLISAGVHLSGTDPFDIVSQLLETPQGQQLDPSHAFYLGFELSKALTALTVGKQYEQDEALNWGFLTRAEKHRRIEKNPRAKHRPE